MMTNIADMTAVEIETRVRELGTLPQAPLVMPKQVLEAAEPLSIRRGLRAILAALHLGSASRQEM